jgi:hypothetical protein
MSAGTHPHGFRIIGPIDGDRLRVDAAAAFLACCHCDPKARIDTEGYLSAFQFGDDFAEHLASNGSPAGFTGPTWAPYVWVDLDRDKAAGGISRALDDLRLLVDTLDETYAVPRNVLLPFISGDKGFHCGIPTPLFLPEASPDFHAIARQFAETIAAEAKVVIDASVFDRVRAFRKPNSRHPRSGLHKRHIPVEVLDTVTVEEVLEMARTPEPFDPPSLDGVESADMLVAVWDAAGRGVAERASAAQQRRAEVASGARAATVNALTRAFLAGEVQQGDRHRLLFSSAANLAELGCPLNAAVALLTKPALDLGLKPKDVARQIECGHAAAHPLVAKAAEIFSGTVAHGDCVAPAGSP